MTDALREFSKDRLESSLSRFPTPPHMRLEEFFIGKTNAIGIFQDRFGKLRRQFSADMEGQVDGDRLELHEVLAYDDGEVETRNWSIKKRGDVGYEGTCENVIGTARGRVTGNVFRWRYDFRLKIGGRQLTVTFDDTMFLQAGNLVINRVRMSKFGITLGEATIVFFKDPTDLAQVYGEDRSIGEVLQAAAE